MNRLKPFLQLTRPPNLITAIGDILGALGLSGYFRDHSLNLRDLEPVILLALSSAFLYGGGVVFNDVLDAELDQVERPERPIPAGRVTKSEANRLGLILFLLGIFLARRVGTLSLSVAGLIVFFALTYDRYAKLHPFWGPLMMGGCRALNFLLGLSILGISMFPIGFLCLIPWIYIYGVTGISRGEVAGGYIRNLKLGGFLYFVSASGLLIWSWHEDRIFPVISALFLWGFLVVPPVFRAIKDPKATRIGKAVKSGVLGILILDACWAFSGGAPGLGFLILGLLPLSFFLTRVFSVT